MAVTISRLYENDAAASRALAELEAAGLGRDATIVASTAEHWRADRPAAGAQSGTAARAGESKPRPDHTTGGDVASAAGGAGVLLASLAMLVLVPGLGAIVAGGIAGALLQRAVGEDEGGDHAEAVRRGGTLVTACVPDAERMRFEAILDRTAVNHNDRAGDRRSAA
jgi:hypothetical protein